MIKNDKGILEIKGDKYDILAEYTLITKEVAENVGMTPEDLTKKTCDILKDARAKNPLIFTLLELLKITNKISVQDSDSKPSDSDSSGCSKSSIDELLKDIGKTISSKGDK